MKFKIDHDLHIHTVLSLCADGDERQNKFALLKYAEDNGLKTICVTDHYWDSAVEGASDWYKPQNFEHISKIKPLPESNRVKFLFGCETELNRQCVLGIPKERFDDFDFIIIPTTHMHMGGGFVVRGDESPKERAELWKSRLNAVLDMDLPFKKVGIAHLTCTLIDKGPKGYLEVLRNISDEDFEKCFKKAAEKGVGIELNFDSLSIDDEEFNEVLRPYKIAKEQGCKFYLGSDAHHPEGFERAVENFSKIVDALGLEETDKFRI